MEMGNEMGMEMEREVAMDIEMEMGKEMPVSGQFRSRWWKSVKMESNLSQTKLRFWYV